LVFKIAKNAKLKKAHPGDAAQRAGAGKPPDPDTAAPNSRHNREGGGPSEMRQPSRSSHPAPLLLASPGRGPRRKGRTRPKEFATFEAIQRFAAAVVAVMAEPAKD
jgi:hypothetical protein